MKNIIFKKAWHAAVFVIILWTAISYGIFYYTTEITESLLPFIIGFLFVYPIGTFTACFLYSKKYGQILMLMIPMLVISAVKYFLLGFDSVEPNYLVMSVLAVFFGCNIGKQFCDNTKTYQLKEIFEAKRKSKEKAEKEYKSIIDDK